MTADAVRVGRRSIKISNPDKVLFPDDGITKSDIIDYYYAVADRMLPHVRDRLMTLERYPDGIKQHQVFTKTIPKYFPDWIDRATVRKKGGTVTHVVCNEKATLVYLANQACITQHVGLSRVDEIDHPDQLIIDLDPSRENFALVRSTALRTKELFEEVGLTAFVKTSGSRGLHITAPLDRSEPFETVRLLAWGLAELLAERHPKELTIEGRKANRRGRLFLDWMRNNYAQTAVAPYTLRVRPKAPAALPLSWDEVEDPKLRPQQFALRKAIKRASEEDPWIGWRRHASSAGRALERLEGIRAEE